MVGTVNDPNYSGTASGTLVITAVPAALSPEGYAASVTGGGTGTAVTITDPTAFKTAVESASPAVITVSGSLKLASKVSIASNKTIQGLDADATIIGNLEVASGVSNVAPGITIWLVGLSSIVGATSASPTNVRVTALGLRR